MTLFHQLFGRVLLLLVAAMLVMVMLTHVAQIRGVNRIWRDDLAQEADWMARHWVGVQDPQNLAAAWGQTHDAVRLVVLGQDGRTLADSQPEREPLTLEDLAGRGLLGSAEVQTAGGPATLVLSRRPPAPFPAGVHGELLLAAVGVTLLAGVAFYPFARRLTRLFERLTASAQRVAAGRFGATLEPPAGAELQTLVAAFNDMSSRLEREEQRKRQLLVDISHELRSPLGRLQAVAETLVRHPQEGDALLAQLQAEVALMSRLIGDLLDTARAEQGSGLSLTLEDVNLGRWAREVFGSLRRRIENAGVRCVVHVDEDEAQIRIDRQRLLQVLGNLVDNALAAVVAPEPEVRLVMTATPDRWTLSVIDNGPGIPEAHHALIFDRFYRLPGASDRAGSGLGLAIARAVVEQHGGRLLLVSSPGSGAEFRAEFER